MTLPSEVPGHVLVVEDSMIIALDVEGTLQGLGVENVVVAASVDDALAAMSAQAPDYAIVDFNLGEETSEPVAQELARQGIPFVFASGDTALADDLDRHGASGILLKPYTAGDIAALFRPA